MKDFLTESLDTRMKGYEKVAAQQFSPRNTIIVRVDGVAFHTYTMGALQPYDSTVGEAMQYATSKVHQAAQGCVLSYTQSDEATFMLTDLMGSRTQGWFGFKKSKLESVMASMFTYHFNSWMSVHGRDFLTRPNGSDNPALFDARAFSVPSEDAPNVFVWRQKDAYRNAISNMARTHIGHSDIQGKSTEEMVYLLTDYMGMQPESCTDPHFLWGTLFSEAVWKQSYSLGYEGFRYLATGGGTDIVKKE